MSVRGFTLNASPGLFGLDLGSSGFSLVFVTYILLETIFLLGFHQGFLSWIHLELDLVSLDIVLLLSWVRPTLDLVLSWVQPGIVLLGSSCLSS